ncbi:hypothetical protein BJX62DRAFT_160290 [Aspergillus germanicus]|uniref:Uncharacterized protein n=1 Tax=Aspergillus keveii TaxID=714993 RepID=A0ABR4G102_9EURO
MKRPESSHLVPQGMEEVGTPSSRRFPVWRRRKEFRNCRHAGGGEQKERKETA